MFAPPVCVRSPQSSTAGRIQCSVAAKADRALPVKSPSDLSVINALLLFFELAHEVSMEWGPVKSETDRDVSGHAFS